MWRSEDARWEMDAVGLPQEVCNNYIHFMREVWGG